MGEDQKYTDKFTLSVVDLTQIENATETDKHYKMDQWALMFKATTWEELNMLATHNPVIDEAVTHIFKLTEKDQIRMQINVQLNLSNIQIPAEMRGFFTLWYS